MLDFGRALPRLRERVRRDLGREGMPREKVVAAIVRLLDCGYLRVGNPEYARENASFGLTTLRDEHARVRGERLRLRYTGKSGKVQELDIQDPRLARIVKRCQDLPGQELFRYLDDEGRPRAVASEDVNEYLRETAGEDFTAKDFRTWAGWVATIRRRRPSASWSPPSARSPPSSATRRPSAASAMSTRRSLRPISREGRWRAAGTAGAAARRPC